MVNVENAKDSACHTVLYCTHCAVENSACRTEMVKKFNNRVYSIVKQGGGNKRVSGRERETTFFFYWAL